ncbi:MAG: ParB/RepB/Spo0J family partition protein [Deltaproteobacteria bacterium]|jgi:ParB family chromosome partitioning protein|nr:ParB/RepB/Spo0J family partition protein [Deltaproteobacteria bacterium]
MSANAHGLGRGLDALFQSTAGTLTKDGSGLKPAAEPQSLSLESLVPNPQQPRRHFAEQQLEELASSIKTQGMLQPILARPMGGPGGIYEIIAGERRWRAAKLAGLSSVPVIIRDLNDQEVLIVALMENLQREDLTPMEEALGLQQLKDEFGLSQEDMAHRLGKSRSAIANTLRLLSLPDAAREDLIEGRISAGHARALLVVTEPQSQEVFRQYLVSSRCTVRDAEGIAAGWKDTGALPEEMARGSKWSGAAKGASATQSETLRALQERIGLALALPVTLRGKETKGRLSVAYSSKEELDALLARLGFAEEDV